MRVLTVSLPYAGHTNPTLPLVRELVRRGHSVTYVNAESFRGRIEETGAAFVPYRDFPAGPTEREKKRLSFRAAYGTAMALPGPFDLLIYEMFFYPGMDIARNRRLPCVRQFSQPAWSENTWRDAPAVFRLSAALIDRQVLPAREARRMGLSHTCLRDGVIRAEPDLNLVYLPEAFQPHREDFGDQYLFLVPDRQPSAGTSVRIPYEELTPPLVYISLGSIISNRGFCRECIRAFGGTEFSVILNTGKIPPETLGGIPDNIRAYSFVPQTEVLRHADVFLTHCGMNSINEALAAGVPMVAMPFLNDQLTNAAQITALGLGKRVRSFPSSGRQLLRTVREVAADREIRAAVGAMREAIGRQIGWDEVIGRIAAVCGQA